MRAAELLLGSGGAPFISSLSRHLPVTLGHQHFFSPSCRLVFFFSCHKIFHRYHVPSGASQSASGLMVLMMVMDGF